ncbi:MAG: hypothetical protein D6698_08775 [Gammaproteobacteria bacterium]|nr:MAG: hypothetical protein D6698_08775 [Gammaproteobacteria bacterium]
MEGIGIGAHIQVFTGFPNEGHVVGNGRILILQPVGEKFLVLALDGQFQKNGPVHRRHFTEGKAAISGNGGRIQQGTGKVLCHSAPATRIDEENHGLPFRAGFQVDLAGKLWTIGAGSGQGQACEEEDGKESGHMIGCEFIASVEKGVELKVRRALNPAITI